MTDKTLEELKSEWDIAIAASDKAALRADYAHDEAALLGYHIDADVAANRSANAATLLANAALDVRDAASDAYYAALKTQENYND